MRDGNGSFEEFIRHVQVVMPAIKELEELGLGHAYIVKLLRLMADWLESRDADRK